MLIINFFVGPFFSVGVSGRYHPSRMNDIPSMALGKSNYPVVLEASDKRLLCLTTFIYLADTVKVLQMKMLPDWWKKDFKKKGRFKKKNERGEKMNGGGEKMISEFSSCLKLKKCSGNSK